MNVKTMEGLAGASASVSMLSTPMSVVKEAERKGDIGKMERALGYAAGLTEQAGEYSEKTSQGMAQDAKEAKAQKEQLQEKLIEARRAERQEQAQRAEQTGQARQEGQAQRTGQAGSAGQTAPGAGGAGDGSSDHVEISEEGKELARTAGQTSAGTFTGTSAVGADGMQDVTYGKLGETAGAVLAAGENVDVHI